MTNRNRERQESFLASKCSGDIETTRGLPLYFALCTSKIFHVLVFTPSATVVLRLVKSRKYMADVCLFPDLVISEEVIDMRREASTQSVMLVGIESLSHLASDTCPTAMNRSNDLLSLRQGDRKSLGHRRFYCPPYLRVPY